MKAFEAKKQTSQSQYEIIMEQINDSIKKGKTNIRIKNGKEISEEAIQKIAKDGFDVNINQRSCGNFYNTLLISWENAKEGKVGVITKEIEPVSTYTPKKLSFWERIDDLFSGADET